MVIVVRSLAEYYGGLGGGGGGEEGGGVRGRHSRGLVMGVRGGVWVVRGEGGLTELEGVRGDGRGGGEDVGGEFGGDSHCW